MAKAKDEVAPEVPQKQFRVGPGKHYRFGRLYEQGEVVSIPEDESPAKDWEPLDDDAAEDDSAPKGRKSKAAKSDSLPPADL